MQRNVRSHVKNSLNLNFLQLSSLCQLISLKLKNKVFNKWSVFWTQCDNPLNPEILQILFDVGLLTLHEIEQESILLSLMII